MIIKPLLFSQVFIACEDHLSLSRAGKLRLRSFHTSPKWARRGAEELRLDPPRALVSSVFPRWEKHDDRHHPHHKNHRRHPCHHRHHHHIEEKPVRPVHTSPFYQVARERVILTLWGLQIFEGSMSHTPGPSGGASGSRVWAGSRRRWQTKFSGFWCRQSGARPWGTLNKDPVRAGAFPKPETLSGVT